MDVADVTVGAARTFSVIAVWASLSTVQSNSGAGDSTTIEGKTNRREKHRHNSAQPFLLFGFHGMFEWAT